MAVARSMVGIVAGAAAAALTLTGCGGGSSDDAKGSGGGGKVSVVASTNVWGDVVRQVAGDHATITSIISSPDQDPHSFEANAKVQLELSRARIVVDNGGGYDDFVPNMLKTARNAKVTVLNAVDISGKKAPSGGELNEHVWYDFPTVAKVTDRIAAALATADSGDASTFKANAATFKGKLSAMEATEAAIKKEHAGDGAAITEPVPLYLLTACGLVNKTPPAFSEAVEEGDDVSARVLKQTLGIFDDKQVKLLAYNEQTSGSTTEQVLARAKKDDVAVVPVTETLPAGKGYLAWMTSNLAAVRSALGGAA